METSLLMTVCGFLLSAATFVIGRMTAVKSAGKQDGMLLTELGYIKKGIDDMNRKMEQIDRRYIDLAERVKALEEVVRVYHREARG